MEILRNLTRRKLRSFLTISGIVIGIMALATMGAMAENFNALLDGGVTYFGSNVQVGDENGAGGFGGGALIPVSKAAEVRKVAGVAYVEPTASVSAKPGAVNTVSFGVPDFISSRDPATDKYSKFQLKVASGQDIDPAARGNVLLGSTIAKEFNKKVGDSLDLPVRPSDAKLDFVNHPFRVVGILQATQTAPDNGAYVSLGDAQVLLGDQLPLAVRGKLDVSTLCAGFVVYGQPGYDLDKIADAINAQVPGVKATKPSTIVSSFKAGGAIFTAITTVAALLALVIGGISVVNTMLMAVTERVREIGLKKAVGARTSRILREFLLEATSIGLLGGVIGFAIGYGLTVLLNLATAAGSSTGLFLMTPRLTILCLAFATVLGAVAGLIPAFRASRLDPVTALRTTT